MNLHRRRPRGSGSGRIGYGSVLRLLCALIIPAAILIPLGCRDPIRRYKVLSFFFDGVPPPPGVDAPSQELIKGPGGVLLDPNDPRTREFLAADRIKRVGVETLTEAVSVLHEPYKKRRCRECHVSEQSFQVPIAADTCRKCHQPYYELQRDDWTHGPVAVGQCAVCHNSHKSDYRGLLTRPAPQLCFSCHDAERNRSAPHHAAAQDRPCVSCHDPHSAGNRMLLVDSTTYQRRAKHLQPLQSGHAKWDRKTCATCHEAERSNRPVGDVDKACISCHQDAQRLPADGQLHDPIKKGKCLSCHVVHRSPLPHLIRPAAEKNCMASGCHKPAEIEKGSHPRMRRADCLVCHAGHSALGKGLLRTIRPPGPGASTRPAGGKAR